MKPLRAHQSEAIEMLRASLRKGKKRPVLQLSVAAGKTRIAAEIVKNGIAKGKRVIFAADAISLIDQTVAAFFSEGIHEIGVIQAQHPLTDYSRKCQVASVQTLSKRSCPKFDIFIQDECHAQFEVIRDLMEDNPDAIFIGLTATPWSKGMGLWWDDLIKPISMKGLIDLGYVMPVVAYAPFTPDLKNVPIKAGEYDEGAVEIVMKGAKVVANAIESWRELGENRPTFAFDVNCATAQNTCDRFNEAGIPWGYIDGKTEASDRKRIFEQLDRGEIMGISSVAALIKGVDRRVACILWRAPTKSPIKLVQGIGRGLRDNPPWTDCIVIDQTGSLLQLGMPADIDRAQLCTKKKGEKSEGEASAAILPKPCPSCGKLKTTAVCACGFQTKRESDVVEGAGQLARIGGDKAGPKKEPPTLFQKQEWLAQLRAYQIAKGKAEGWVIHSYRERFGENVGNLRDVRPMTVGPEVSNWIKAKNIRWAKGQARRHG
jgi:DNA repair protein RadD